MAMNYKKIAATGKKYLSDLILILEAAVVNFQKKGAARGAAGMAYYTLLSLFPLLIVLVTIGSYFVDSGEASSKVAQMIISVIPVSQNFVELNIQRIMVIRSSVGVVSLIVFVWSGSNAFSMMVHHITSAWPETEQRTFFQKRLFGLAMVILIILIQFILMVSSTLLNALVKFRSLIPGLEFLLNSSLWHFGAKSLYWAVPFLFFYSLYRIIPMGRVPIKAAGFSALGITLLWRSASALFQWYLRSGFARYEVIFGSLNAVVVLLFWIYISTMILFFGAHLCAASSGKISLKNRETVNLTELK
jgi:membrane protein